MVRATFGADNVWIVGQYTYNGHVMAAQHWGGVLVAAFSFDEIFIGTGATVPVVGDKPWRCSAARAGSLPNAPGGGAASHA